MNPLAHSVSMNVSGVLVDMDGVLIDSTARDERCWLRWARFHGMEKEFSIKATHGRRGIDTLHNLRPDLDPIVELNRLEYFDEEDGDCPAIYPGVREFLGQLEPKTWTIVSSASERLMRNRLRLAGFQAPLEVVSANRVTRGKPDPEPYQVGAAILGLVPSQCLVIEDAPSGIESGKAAGCKVLAVITSHSALELAKADWIVPSLEHVHAIPQPDGSIVVQLTRTAESES
ncbi:MAG: HAD-IA family hydrolase [Terracidiphilus sp.]